MVPITALLAAELVESETLVVLGHALAPEGQLEAIVALLTLVFGENLAVRDIPQADSIFQEVSEGTANTHVFLIG